MTDSEYDERRRSIGARRNPEAQEAILDAAEAILIEDGAAAFSIEAVARRARAGKPTIYRWWPTRGTLLLDIYHRQKPAVIHADTGSLEEDVTLFIERLLEYWKGGAGQVFRVVVAEAQRDVACAEALRTYAAGRRRQTAAMFERAIARGEISPDTDSLLAAEMLAALAWHRLLTDRLAIDRNEAKTVARQVVRGLKVSD
ncbi:TetR/AcrR family transcriptional regulator [Devosia nitrariae]|uniref:TetR family transcriptional regulator n=1 Tax=Devosia nitrariae TaxID=2071872 RepID=A0ABQ5W2S0_9HYPH|nr:TetR/AcrR family transcriptional regulator [Devosia nitrariae]GLQ54116.1 TetR family transcriptional regulator [Devosia nitrariae]